MGGRQPPGGRRRRDTSRSRTTREKGQEARANPDTEKSSGGSSLVSGIVMLVAAGGLAAYVLFSLFHHPNPPGHPSLAFTRGRPIDGIPCTSEILSYHVHAHLDIFDRGVRVPVPAGIGINYNRGCFYWLHTHDDSGMIHIEAPHTIHPRLRVFFDIWGEQINRKRASTARVRPREDMLVFVNLRRYHGNPAGIVLEAHTLVTIEVGPPFLKPAPFNFGPN